MLRKGNIMLLVCLGLLLFPEGVAAQCSFATVSPFNTAKILNMPINATISVTPDLAVGQVVYEQNIMIANQGGLFIDCDTRGPFYYGFDLATSLSETTAGSKIYATNLMGIGVKFGADGGGIPVTVPVGGYCSNSENCQWGGGFSAYSWLQLVKTGNTITPGTINGSDLPILISSVGQSGNLLEIYRINITGTIKVTVPTCNITPASKAMTIQMGKHKMSDFSGIGSHTHWVDASIHLDGCGRFDGYASTVHATFDGSATLIPRTPLTRNNFTVTLTPRDGVSSGAMKIKQQAYGAVGFGIQLSRNQSDAGVLNLTEASYNYTDPLSNNGSTTVTVPLYARYIQTAATAIAGKADGTLEYTVSYH